MQENVVVYRKPIKEISCHPKRVAASDDGNLQTCAIVKHERYEVRGRKVVIPNYPADYVVPNAIANVANGYGVAKEVLAVTKAGRGRDVVFHESEGGYYASIRGHLRDGVPLMVLRVSAEKVR